MEQSENFDDELRCKIAIEELQRFKKLLKGHEKLLEAVGNL